MSSYLEIIADIRSKLAGVQDTGVIHDYGRWSADQKRFIDLFSWTPVGKETKQIRGWEFTRVKRTEHDRGAHFIHHLFQLSGYLGLRDKDASEIEFQLMVDAVCDAFAVAEAPRDRGYYYMNGDEPDQAPAQALTIDARSFGGVLCHHADILLSVTERVVR
ncbi:MAG: hypothetical protein LLG97_19375 [Deltaproteobacteria bacterium]|nr:hypothetical protein [Deltaproteobacteria bacterium]